MKKSTKAALLSALIFPGSGHIYLKKYMAGALLAGVSFAAIYYLISNAVEKAFKIIEKVQHGDVQPDINEIAKLVSQQSTGADIQLMNIAATALFICWLIGIIDSYRVGYVLDKKR